jgi:hypothetical protein
VIYGLVMLLRSTNRKRIVSSGLWSSTVASWLSCVRLVSTLLTRFALRCRGIGCRAPRHGRGLSRLADESGVLDGLAVKDQRVSAVCRQADMGRAGRSHQRGDRACLQTGRRWASCAYMGTDVPRERDRVGTAVLSLDPGRADAMSVLRAPRTTDGLPTLKHRRGPRPVRIVEPTTCDPSCCAGCGQTRSPQRAAGPRGENGVCCAARVRIVGPISMHGSAALSTG